jgi:hypothetical protein
MRPRRTRNGIELQATAHEVISAAVNFANAWSLEDLGFEESDAMRKMLAEVYDQILDANRSAQQRGSKLVRRVPSVRARVRGLRGVIRGLIADD